MSIATVSDVRRAQADLLQDATQGHDVAERNAMKSQGVYEINGVCRAVDEKVVEIWTFGVGMVLPCSGTPARPR